MTLFEAVSATIRRLHDSPRTEEAYLRWVREFIRSHNRRHPRERGAAEITAFLNDLPVRRRTSASTPTHALCARVFPSRKVLEIEMPALAGLERAQRPRHLPNVLSRRDVLALLDRLEPPFRFLGEILDGAGLHLQAALSLRVRGVDLERHPITVRRGGGAQDRTALRPALARGGTGRAARGPSPTPPRRARRGPPRGRPSVRPSREASERGDEPRVAVPLPRVAPLHGPYDRAQGALPPARDRAAADPSRCRRRRRA